ncbi:hypothetical protein PPYR_14642 [Photinus pyralis]|uniref:Uncharacterized protein n=1 Tax=Photinus pyralis TaxID=7054 RepID=A0A5N4A5T1_PHOPY|nr:uncharacterized protein LOC116181456 [Photinus pyralis]KAB0792683.1 hypothetical protein PPYR_14642 [Photinus pyralis]
MNLLRVFVYLPLAFLASQAATPEEIANAWRKQIAPFETVCACESGSSVENIQSTWASFTYPTNPCFKCYFPCLYRKLGLVLPDGSINRDVMIKTVLGVTGTIYDTCMAPVVKCLDPCYKIWAFDYCVSYVMNYTAVKPAITACT